MITLYTSFKRKEFSSQVPDVEFAITLDRALVTVTASKSGDQLVAYSEYLFPDSNGKISLCDMDRLIEPYATRWLVFSLGVTIREERITTNNEGVEVVSEHFERSLSTEIISCRANILNTTASVWCLERFLSLIDGPKSTAIGWVERLTYIGSAAATCTAYYEDGGSIQFSVPEVFRGDAITVDVSSVNFMSSGRRLMWYQVTAGSRSQKYEVDYDVDPDVAPVLLFWNSFGVQELAYCTGELKQVSSYDRKQARIGRLKKTYDMEEKETFRADTGYLTYPMANWWREVFRSRELVVCPVYNGVVETSGKPIVIISEKQEMSNAPDALPRFTFEYEYADRNHSIFDVRAEGRIFDDTFDDTFN